MYESKILLAPLVEKAEFAALTPDVRQSYGLTHDGLVSDSPFLTPGGHAPHQPAESRRINMTARSTPYR